MDHPLSSESKPRGVPIDSRIGPPGTDSENVVLHEKMLEGLVVVDRSWRYIFVNETAARFGRTSVENLLNRTVMDCFPGIEATELFRKLKHCMDEGTSDRFEAELFYPDGTKAWLELSVIPSRQGIQVYSLETSERRKAQSELARRLSELEAVREVSKALRTAETVEEILPLLLKESLRVLNIPRGAIWLYDPEEDIVRPVITQDYGEEIGKPPPPGERPGEGIVGRVFSSGMLELSYDLRQDERLAEHVRERIPPGDNSAALPIATDRATIGVFTAHVDFPRTITPEDLSLLTTLCDIGGIAIHRARLHEQTERRLEHLSVLSEIDQVIASTFDLHVSLPILLGRTTEQLNADAADIHIYRPATRRLEYFAGSGFRSRRIEESSFAMGEGKAGTAALERRVVCIQDLNELSPPLVRKNLLVDEGFVTYYGVPLIAKGEVNGLLEIFTRSPLRADKEWLSLLESFGRQAALAIDNVTLFEGLERSNLELKLAYDANIEGWSRALDLRDKETEGHTVRVAELTGKLARAFGIPDEQLLHIRWGSLLHDIGKMGVPDSILLKDGPLTDDEWIVMRKHPVLAFEMLAPIKYLGNAIDIPYCHHEKWDGTGYPRGLKGEQIPIAARLFAVVDVWDALRSDRPYRQSWPAKKVKEYIAGLSGKHFDPKVVEVFLRVIDEPVSLATRHSETKPRRVTQEGTSEARHPEVIDEPASAESKVRSRPRIARPEQSMFRYLGKQRAVEKLRGEALRPRVYFAKAAMEYLFEFGQQHDEVLKSLRGLNSAGRLETVIDHMDAKVFPLSFHVRIAGTEKGFRYSILPSGDIFYHGPVHPPEEFP